jgi:transposase
MSPPVPYFEVVRQMKNAFNYRLRLVTHARQHGIKAAARAFRTTVPTVRKWGRRYEAQGLEGLKELARAPHFCPHKITGELAQRVVELRRQLPTFGARRLQLEGERPWAIRPSSASCAPTAWSSPAGASISASKTSQR